MPVALSDGGDGATGEEMKCAYVVMIMAVYWVTEALPLEVTSLIPMVGFPLLGIMSTVSSYTTPIPIKILLITSEDILKNMIKIFIGFRMRSA